MNHPLTTRAALLAVVLFAALLCACPPPSSEDSVTLYGVTGAPPSATSSVDNREEFQLITLTQDTAFGVFCSATCDNACASARFTVEPEKLAEVRPIYTLSGARRDDYALIGKGEGSGQLTVDTECASFTYNLRVLPNPTRAQTATED